MKKTVETAEWRDMERELHGSFGQNPAARTPPGSKRRHNDYFLSLNFRPTCPILLGHQREAPLGSRSSWVKVIVSSLQQSLSVEI
jgi:hypothetical protein